MKDYAFSLRIGSSILECLGVTVGDFNICELEEGRLSVWNQTFTEGDTGKTAFFFFRFFPHMSLKSHSPTSQGKSPQPMVQYALYPEMT